MISESNEHQRLLEITNASFGRAAWNVLREARRAGTTIVTWEDECTKHLTPDEYESRLRAACPEGEPPANSANGEPPTRE